MITHSEVKQLARHPQQFPLIAEYLSGATTEVAFERDGQLQSRTHVIVDVSRFPLVKMAVEGSSSVPAERQLFAPAGPYENALWELADPQDEHSIQVIIRQSAQRNAAAIAAGEAELARRIAERMAAEEEANALRTAALAEEARARLLIAWRSPRGTRGWRAVLQDLDAVLPSIARPGDRIFVAQNAARGRRTQNRPSELQLRWLADILDRTGYAFASTVDTLTPPPTPSGSVGIQMDT